MSDYLSESCRGVEHDLIVALELADTPEQCITISREADQLGDLCRQIEREARLKGHTLLMARAAQIGVPK